MTLIPVCIEYDANEEIQGSKRKMMNCDFNEIIKCYF